MTPKINLLIESFKIFLDFVKGFWTIQNYMKSVSFFGSARESLPERYYTEAEELSAILTKKGFAVITGGGGGIMRAANKGAFKVGGDSVGINIILPEEQHANMYLNRKVYSKFFFSRKTILSCSSELYIFFPGGFGTMDELFEMLTLIQTRHSEMVPIILYGEDFWNPIIKVINVMFKDKYKTISEGDIKLYTLVDSVEEADRYIDRLNITNTRSCKVGKIS